MSLPLPQPEHSSFPRHKRFVKPMGLGHRTNSQRLAPTELENQLSDDYWYFKPFGVFPMAIYTAMAVGSNVGYLKKVFPEGRGKEVMV
jgi:hypothetical protein